MAGQSMPSGKPDLLDRPIRGHIWRAFTATGDIQDWLITALEQVWSKMTLKLGRPAPPIIITQGNHNKRTPGEAHDNGGVMDLRVRHLTKTELTAFLLSLDEVGFAAYDLGPPTWARHVHVVYRADPGLNQAARDQVTRFDNRGTTPAARLRLWHS